MNEAMMRIKEGLMLDDMKHRDDLSVEFFDPWAAVFPMLYGSYDSSFSDCAIALMKSLILPNWTADDLATDILRELLCGQGLCDYGTSPRVCFPTSEFKAVLPEIIARWKHWYEIVWNDPYAPFN